MSISPITSHLLSHLTYQPPSIRVITMRSYIANNTTVYVYRTSDLIYDLPVCDHLVQIEAYLHLIFVCITGNIYSMPSKNSKAYIEFTYPLKAGTSDYVHDCLAIQLYSWEELPISLELTILDSKNLRKRIYFSTSYHGIDTNELHAKVPWNQSNRNIWTNVIFPLESLTSSCFPGSIFQRLESFQLKPCCRIRKIFLISSTLLQLDRSSIRIPPALDFNPSIEHLNYVFSPSGGDTNSNDQRTQLRSKSPKDMNKRKPSKPKAITEKVPIDDELPNDVIDDIHQQFLLLETASKQSKALDTSDRTKDEGIETPFIKENLLKDLKLLRKKQSEIRNHRNIVESHQKEDRDQSKAIDSSPQPLPPPTILSSTLSANAVSEHDIYQQIDDMMMPQPPNIQTRSSSSKLIAAGANSLNIQNYESPRSSINANNPSAAGTLPIQRSFASIMLSTDKSPSTMRSHEIDNMATSEPSKLTIINRSEDNRPTIDDNKNRETMIIQDRDYDNIRNDPISDHNDETGESFAINTFEKRDDSPAINIQYPEIVENMYASDENTGNHDTIIEADKYYALRRLELLDAVETIREQHKLSSASSDYSVHTPNNEEIEKIIRSVMDAEIEYINMYGMESYTMALGESIL